MLTRLCITNPPHGTKKGQCCVCGAITDKGFRAEFSNNFTGYSYLTHGDCLCPHCYAFFKDQNFRRKSWIATSHTVSFLTRTECRDVILNPPEPPFYLYITQTGQRQGWLSALKHISYSRDNFFIVTDWVGFFIANRDTAEQMDRLITALREKKVSKTALKTGEYSMHQYRLAIQEGYSLLIEQAKRYVKDPLWEVMVYVAD